MRETEGERGEGEREREREREKGDANRQRLIKTRRGTFSQFDNYRRNRVTRWP